MSRLLVTIFTWIHDQLHSPLKVLTVCILVAFVSLVVEGSLFHLWSLHRNSSQLSRKISRLEAENRRLDMKIEKVSDPNYLELEVRDQFDYVQEGDLVFVFTESK